MVNIRLKRLGATKRPFYRVVVADARSPRDGRFIEQIGKYHPMEDPSFIEIDGDRALYWLREGAQPTSQVRNLLKIEGVWETFEAGRSKAKAKASAGATRAVPAKKSAAKAAAKPAEQAEATSAPAEA